MQSFFYGGKQMEKNALMVLVDEVSQERKWVKPANLKIKVGDYETTLGELVNENLELKAKIQKQDVAINNILKTLSYLETNIELVKVEVM